MTDGGWLCIDVTPSGDLAELCESVYKAFLELLRRGRRFRLLVRSSSSRVWVEVSNCLLTRNLVATVEVYSAEDPEEGPTKALREQCQEVVAVPVAPPTSQLRERRQVIP